MKKLTVAIVGLEHVHSGCMYADFSKHPDKFEIIGCADIPARDDDIAEDVESRMKRNMRKAVHDGIKVYDDYKELLTVCPDVVVVCSNMRRYPDIVEETLSLGLNTVIEKPMAMTYADGIRMYNAYKKSDALFAINWPVAWFESFAKVKEIADSGEIGEVLRVHYRSPATMGPYTHNDEGITKEEEEKYLRMFWYHHNMGGGSSLDYGGYGCTLATLIFGRQAERVSGIRKNFLLGFSDVEDYVNYTLDFGRGVADVEGSWSTINTGEIPSGPVVYGSKGTIVADRYGSDVKVYKGFSHTFTEPTNVYTLRAWNELEYTLPVNIYDHIVYKKPLYEMITPEFNIKALAALDAGIRSSYSGKWEETEKNQND